MRPSTLRTGDTVRAIGSGSSRILTFIERDAGKRQSTLQCDDYKGLAGHNDEGYVVITDWDMARKYERVNAQKSP